MELDPQMGEAGFIRAIHDNFFFPTDREYEEAARVGCRISDNAALTVGYELAAGASHASPEANRRLLEILEEERPTPVILAAIPVIRSLLEPKPVAREDILRLLAACREHSNAWSGLGIVLCADVSLEEECEQIMAGWRRAGGFPEDH
jgi:hypothetical protein